MQDQKSRFEIVEYNKSYASVEEVKKVMIKNYLETKNARSFAGTYLSMSLKYGKLTYVILTVPALLLYFVLRSLILIYGAPPEIAGIALLFTIMIANCLFFGLYLPRKGGRVHSDYGYEMLTKFEEIDKKYKNEGGLFLLAVVNDTATGAKELVGTLGFRKVQKDDREIYNIPDESLRCGIIESVGVISKYRGMGLSRKLVDEAMKFAEAEKYDTLYLGVLRANDLAVKLYEKYGFKITNVIEIEPISGYAGCLMMKKLR